MSNSSLAVSREQTETVTDLISKSAAIAISATLNHIKHPASGDPLPPLWHWIYFGSKVRQSLIAEDGHPIKGAPLPDLGLPRRMAAGGRLQFHAPLTIGKIATRKSQVISAQHKEGRSGKLALITVAHTIASEGRTAIYEEQDILYRQAAVPGEPQTPPEPATLVSEWQQEVHPTEILLFRYSALTFNAHRIHYDEPYTRAVGGYTGLVVHGPLIATLLMDLLARNLPDATVLGFSYRAVRPTFLGNSFYACGRPLDDGQSVDLWAKDHEGWLTMSASATLTDPGSCSRTRFHR